MSFHARLLARFSSFFVLASGLVGCPTPAEAPWQIVTQDRSEALLSVGGSSARDVWAVGADHGAGPLVLRYDGTDWTRLDAGVRGIDLWWVHSLSENDVLFAGARGAILRFDGSTFARMDTPGLARQVVFGVWARSPTQAWAVGSVAGRSGFLWRLEGGRWLDVPLPRDLPLDAEGEVPGLFKVWGDADEVYAVGNAGLVLRSTDGTNFEVVETGSSARLFTVAGGGDLVVAVGGGGTGTVLESLGAGPFEDHTPALAGLVQGVFVTPSGAAWASGAGATIFERRAEGWARVEHRLSVFVESLHAVWVDPEGGVWAAGGDVISPSLEAGVLIHRGPAVPTYDPTPPAPDAGPEGGAPVASCPEAAIDRAPAGSIARRWNEQILDAIRRDVPRPGVHARNLFHLSVAMWDAWAAYDSTADGYLVRERHVASDVAAAREEAISYAAYRVLAHRYAAALAVGASTSNACFRAFMERLGYDPDDTVSAGDTPRALGNRIGAAVIAYGLADGANETMAYADTTGWTPTNAPLYVDQPSITIVDPSVWQQLDLAVSVAQNGVPLGTGPQTYIGASWGLVTPFALSRPAAGEPYFDLAPAPAFSPALAPFVVDVIRRASELDPTLGASIDLSPGALGDNTLGTNDGDGRPTNPVTGAPYAANVVPLGDFGRVLAEFWADGPRSETPPGHWNVLANQVADHPLHARRLEGSGAELDALEWDVKVYFALNGAVHDAAIAAWELKRRFTTSRPITLVRYMASLGQSSEPTGPAYDPGGLPLVPGLVEVVTAASAAPGERHAHLFAHVGEVAIFAWRGEPGDRASEIGGSGWIRGVEWMPYQLRTFVTPAFPGFVSGHSTFSRAGAEVLAAITGSPAFPGGLGSFTASRDEYLTFERGPSVDVRLEWATYYDAADQAGQSRIWGGIHIEPDDLVGRRMGSAIGIAAYALARRHFDGTAAP